MAVTYVTGTVDITGANPNGDYGFPTPTGINPYDVVIGYVYSRAGTKTVTNNSSATQVTDNYQSTTNGGMVWLGYYVVQPSDFTSDTVWSPPADWLNLSSVSNGTTGLGCVVFRGVDISTPVDYYSTPVSGGPSANPNPPSCSTGSGDCLLVYFGSMQEFTTNPPTVPTNFTISDLRWSTTAGTDGSAGIAYDLDGGTGSAVDPGTWTLDGDAASAYWYAGHFALKLGKKYGYAGAANKGAKVAAVAVASATGSKAGGTTKQGTADVFAVAVAGAGSTKPGRSSSVAVAVASAASTKPARSSVVACAVASATGGRIKRGTANVFAVASTGGGGADSLTVWSSTADGRISSSSTTWSTARRGLGTLNVSSTGTAQSPAGAYLSAGTYVVYEMFWSYDTSSIGSGKTITTSTMSLWGSEDKSTTDFTAQLRSFDWGAAVDTSDFRSGDPSDANSADEYTLLATFATSGGWSTTGYNAYTSESAFLAAIAATGTTYIMGVSSRVISGDEPTGDEYVAAYTADDNTGGGGTDRDPKLYVEYTSGTAGPTGQRIRQRTADVFAVALGAAAGTSIGAPATVTVVMSGEDRYVTWDAVVGATGYVVERSVDGGAWTQESP